MRNLAILRGDFFAEFHTRIRNYQLRYGWWLV